MGESTRANNRGIPSTPRDGAPIELVGLAHRVALTLSRAFQAGHIRRDSFVLDGSRVTWVEWADLIRSNFESNFLSDSGFYKDTYGGGGDDKFRCNYPIALALSPGLTTQPDNARKSISLALDKLHSGLGLCTLSPDDVDYRASYYADDSDDPTTAKGANYHQGPSWLWPMGYLAQAAVHFNIDVDRIRLIMAEQEDFLVYSGLRFSNNEIKFKYVLNIDWLGLPELQNENGAHCPGSCPIQTWSHATMIEVMHLMSTLKKT